MEEKSKTHPINHSRRLEALTDGIFAIAATILVLEIRVPEIKDSSTHQLLDSLKETLPSLVAFVFSFLNILIFGITCFIRIIPVHSPIQSFVNGEISC